MKTLTPKQILIPAQEENHQELGGNMMMGLMLTLGVAAIVGAVMSVVLASLGNDPSLISSNPNISGNATLAINSGKQAISGVATKLILYGTIVVFAIILAAVFIYRRFA